ncbi:MAG: beta-lactamase family protein [Flavobacteriales bacterium]|nr:beta-lactamase family protein [Flavobacteriales bacterium]
MKKLLFFIFFIVFNLSFAQLEKKDPELVGVSSERLNRVSEISKNYVAEGKVPGIVTMIARKGKLIYFEAYGNRGVDSKVKIKKNDLFRIYSMTKPVTAIAAMQLYEKGKFQLNDPITKYLPELNNLKRYNSKGELIDVKTEITMQQLLTHTAGFTYGWGGGPVDKKYEEVKLWESDGSKEFIDKVSSLPLLFEPGTKWHYSIAVDITGVIIERLSGKTFSEYLSDNIFAPLGMKDTFFEVPNNKLNRFLPNHYYNKTSNSLGTINEDNTKISAGSNYEKVKFYSGGGGLVSTAMDFMIFSECVRNGGLYNGKRIIGPKTVKFMTKNHLSGSLSGKGGSGESPSWDTTSMDQAESNGFGFGLGFGLVTDSVKRSIIGSDGEYSWGGAAGTIFWIDPVEEISVISMIQLMNSPWPLREELKVATYQSLVEINE